MMETEAQGEFADPRGRPGGSAGVDGHREEAGPDPSDLDPGRNRGHRSNEIPPQSGNPGAPPTETSSAYHNESGPQPPAKPSYGDGSKSTTQVNTAAVKTFAANMGSLSTVLRDSHKGVQAIRPVAAGTFPSAVALAGDVKQLKDEVEVALGKMVEALVTLENTMTRIAGDYESTDEAGKMTADELGTYMADVNGAVRVLA